jgi:hypothetical protein
MKFHETQVDEISWNSMKFHGKFHGKLHGIAFIREIS